MKGLVREIVLTNMLINKARRAVEGVVVVAATFERHLVSLLTQHSAVDFSGF